MAAEVFEREVVRYFAKHRLHQCGRWHNPDVPHHFILRLMQEHVGSAARNNSWTANKAHIVTDELMRQMRQLGKNVQRADILHDVCEAFIGGNRDFLKFEPWYFWDGQEFESDPKIIKYSAFAVAVIMRYEDVQEAMLKAIPMELNTRDLHFGLPLMRAIRLGYIGTVQRLLSAGCDTLLKRKNVHAAALAAEAGHTEMVELVVNFSSSHEWEAHGSALVAATRYQHWSICEMVLEKWGNHIQEAHLTMALCWASRHGADFMIKRIMEYDVRPRSKSVWGCKKIPLQEAVRGGHLETVKLLLDNGAMGDEVEFLQNNITRFLAMSGNTEILQLLRGYYFWKPRVEYVLLPIAAEHGHLQMAKLAVEKPIMPRNATCDFLDYSRYFSLLRAVIMGRYNIVRWLVKEVGIDPNKAVWQDRQDLTPLVLAVDTGNINMVRLLIKELDAEVLREEYVTMEQGFKQSVLLEFEKVHRLSRQERLESMREYLKLDAVFSKDYYHVPQSRVNVAMKVAKGF